MRIKGKIHGNILNAIFDGDGITTVSICGKLFKETPIDAITEVFVFLEGSVNELERWTSYGGEVFNVS